MGYETSHYLVALVFYLLGPAIFMGKLFAMDHELGFSFSPNLQGYSVPRVWSGAPHAIIIE